MYPNLYVTPMSYFILQLNECQGWCGEGEAAVPLSATGLFDEKHIHRERFITSYDSSSGELTKGIRNQTKSMPFALARCNVFGVPPCTNQPTLIYQVQLTLILEAAASFRRAMCDAATSFPMIMTRMTTRRTRGAATARRARTARLQAERTKTG